jgi:hypothetical protein
LAPNYPALKTPYYHTKPQFLRKQNDFICFGILFSFSISFKYDFDKSVILAKPNKDKFYIRACLSFSQNQLDIILFYVHISKIHQKKLTSKIYFQF